MIEQNLNIVFEMPIYWKLLTKAVDILPRPHIQIHPSNPIHSTTHPSRFIAKMVDLIRMLNLFMMGRNVNLMACYPNHFRLKPYYLLLRVPYVGHLNPNDSHQFEL